MEGLEIRCRVRDFVKGLGLGCPFWSRCVESMNMVLPFTGSL